VSGVFLMDQETINYYQSHAVDLACLYDRVGQGIDAYFAQSFLPNTKVLDVGCGSGRDLHRLIDMDIEAYGVDVSSSMLGEAVIRYPNLAECLIEDSLPSLGRVGDDSYDGVLCSATLMHLPEEYLFDSCYSLRRVLKEGGTLLISIPGADTTIDDQTHKDKDDRFFSGITPEKLQLILERVGFQLLNRWQRRDGLARENRTWHTLLFRQTYDHGSRSLDKIEAVLNRDKKVTTYKPALFRALAEIAVTQYNLATWHDGGQLSLPISAVSEKWVEYYWPIIESDDFIPQIQAETADSTRPIAFRQMMVDLIADFSQRGGLAGFISAYRNGKLSESSASLYKHLLRKLNRAIIDGPVKHSGGIYSDDAIFSYDRNHKSIVMPADIWRELSMMGAWIHDATVLRWAELTARLSKETIRPSQVIDCLLKRPDPARDVKAARGFYLQLNELSCVWSDQSLKPSCLAVDHAIPYALWKNNELWNLFPANDAINRQKSNKLPTHELIQLRKDGIISNWERMHTRYQTRFEYEVSNFAGRDIAFNNGNWQNRLFASFVESVEVTATQRGVERWAP
jgi:SAM-dependent methyltransferase